MTARAEAEYLRKLQVDLDELEHTDPAVATAAQSYDDMVRRQATKSGRSVPTETTKGMHVITAKVAVTNKVEQGEGDNRQAQLTFHADYNDGRNKEWSRYTPSLTVQMMVTGPVADQFEMGQAYTLQFVESDD